MVSDAVSGFVLAGGKSSRMGRNKAMLPWPGTDGGTLLSHAVDRVRQVCASVQICGQVRDLEGFSAGPALACLPDSLPDAGPLGGIVSALEQSRTDWNLFLAVDLPLVPTVFLQSLLTRVPTDGEAPCCVIPTLEGQPQPLCSLLHRLLAVDLRRALEAGKYKVMLAIETAGRRMDLWEIQELTAVDNLPPREWFLNVNTPTEWDHARWLAGQGRPSRT